MMRSRGYTQTPTSSHKVWNTVASHRLSDHQDVFKLLEELADTRRSAPPPRVDPIGMKAPKKNGIERIKIFLGKLKESLGGKNRNYIFKARVKPDPTESSQMSTNYMK
ncbi:hypothetical protein H4Q26_013443 [Puccinia striiformis f. sp. tritici PST-130]|nr:hypothetical protein H4Q26_013443 [Puccinia striiformis f. sp. tritici PST-130]